MQDGAPITEGYHTGFEREYSDKTLEGIVAFANSEGGTLYIGVDDDGTVVGVEDLDEASRAAATGISDNIRPDIMPFVSVEGTRIDDRDVVEIRVHEGMNKPYFLKSKGPREGGVFTRRGPASIPASESYIYKMIRDEPNETYESSLSIRQNLTFEETARIFSERGIGFGQPQMSSMGLMDGQMYTNLAFILSDQFDQDFRMALYEDDYKDSFVDRMESTGSVLRQFEDAYRFVDRYNRRSSRIVGKYREDRRDYPEEVVREALINAVAHRDYSLRGSTLVSMFEDRLEITSMGGLYRNIGLDDIMLGVSSRRNERLASVLNRLDLMETYGTPHDASLCQGAREAPYRDQHQRVQDHHPQDAPRGDFGGGDVRAGPVPGGRIVPEVRCGGISRDKPEQGLRTGGRAGVQGSPGASGERPRDGIQGHRRGAMLNNGKE